MIKAIKKSIKTYNSMEKEQQGLIQIWAGATLFILNVWAGAYAIKNIQAYEYVCASAVTVILIACVLIGLCQDGLNKLSKNNSR